MAPQPTDICVFLQSSLCPMMRLHTFLQVSSGLARSRAVHEGFPSARHCKHSSTSYIMHVTLVHAHAHAHAQMQ